jgi:protein SCO1
VSRAARPALLALMLTIVGCAGEPAGPELRDYGPFHDFELTADDGARFDTAALRGTPILLFFGYTSCPDVCPTTLSRLGEAIRLAAAEGHAATPLFVSVDPTVDTPERLAEYLGFFQFPGRGLTGTPEEIEAVMRSTGIFASRTPVDGGYVIDHTASVLLVDATGRLRFLFQPDDPPRLIADALARLAQESPR